MAWATRLIGFVPHGNWDWPGGVIWCNGALYALIWRGYRWGSIRSETDAFYAGGEDGWWILRLKDKGFTRVLGGGENMAEYSGAADPLYWYNAREGYGPNATLGWVEDLRFAADDRYIYMLDANSPAMWRFDTETLDFRLWQWNDNNGAAIVDGDGNNAQLGRVADDFFVYGDGYLWFIDYDTSYVAAIRKMSTSPPYTITTVATSAAHDYNWMAAINPATGFPHAYDDGVFGYGHYINTGSDVYMYSSYTAAYSDGWLYIIQSDISAITSGFRRFNPSTGEWQTIFVLEDDKDLLPPDYHTPGTPYYGQANNPAMQPERNWLPFMRTGPVAAVIAGGKFYARTWLDDDYEYNYWNAQNGNRNLIIDLDDVLARAPFWTSHIEPDWELYPPYPHEWHNGWWGQKLYWSQGTNTQDHYAGSAGLTTDGENVYVATYTWWFDTVTNYYEAAQAISILYEHEPSSNTGYDVRVKFEGPALQAYSAQKPISLTKKIGPLQLS